MTGYCDDCGNTACICPIPSAADAQATPPAGGDVPDLARFLCETEGLLLQCAAQLRRDREVLERAREHVMESESENDHLRAEVERLTAELEEARIDPNDSVIPHRPSPNVVRVRTRNVGIVQARPMIHPDDLEPDPRDAEIDALRAELLAARETMQQAVDWIELPMQAYAMKYGVDWSYGADPVPHMTALKRFLEARASDVPSILPPSSMGDIENTAERYAEAAQLRGETTVTINPYVGPETALPFLRRGIGIIVPISTAWGPEIAQAVRAWAEGLSTEHPGLVTVLEPPEARAAAGGGQGEASDES